MSGRENLIAKIKALKAKTRGNGCTEAEAQAAFEKAQQLMREHRLSEDDIDIAECHAKEVKSPDAWRRVLIATVAWCTNSVAVRSSEGRVTFIGREPGPEIAIYLRDVCYNAIRREREIFRLGCVYRARRTPKTRAAAVLDFTNAMVRRLQSRLIELFSADHDEAAVALAVAARDKRVSTVPSAPARMKKARFTDAVMQGDAAGRRTHLARGVNGGAETKMIGERS